MNRRDPDPIIRILEGYRGSAVLRAAIELDLFTALPGTAAAIARARRCSARGARVVLDVLAALGLVRKARDRYLHTGSSRTFLSRRSPAYCGDVAGLFVHPAMWNAYLGLPQAVRAGRSVLPRNAHSAGQRFWVDFARITASQSKKWAEALIRLVKPARDMNVLDVACGSGVYGLEYARRGARVTLQDQAHVLATARKLARGTGGRVSFLAGDAFRVPWGGPYDLIILSHVLHHFDARGCRRLLDKARRALAPGGTVAIQEFVPDEARRSRLRPLLFAVVMLLWTRSGDAYTWRELRAMLASAGFPRARLVGWNEPRQVILATASTSSLRGRGGFPRPGSGAGRDRNVRPR